MHKTLLPAVLGASLLATPVSANADTKDPQPIAGQEPNAEDVAKTPITDLNLDKEQIPPVLQAAVTEPYSLDGLKSCRTLTSAVTELDGYLGPDLDLPQKERDKISAGRLAKSAVGSLIPFRFLIREVSGANDQEKKIQAAIQAGLARRGFLKGIGMQRGCKYPARPAPAAMVAARKAELAASKMPAKEEQDHPATAANTAGATSADSSGTRYESRPVVQKIP